MLDTSIGVSIVGRDYCTDNAQNILTEEAGFNDRRELYLPYASIIALAATSAVETPQNVVVDDGRQAFSHHFPDVCGTMTNGPMGDL